MTAKSIVIPDEANVLVIPDEANVLVIPDGTNHPHMSFLTERQRSSGILLSGISF
jgi:hypothetical protein